MQTATFEYKKLTRRHKAILTRLARGEETAKVAKRFRCSKSTVRRLARSDLGRQYLAMEEDATKLLGPVSFRRVLGLVDNMIEETEARLREYRVLRTLIQDELQSSDKKAASR